ncbi:hypothetical protein [Meiothermus sp.]|uniref:hypothetical protein n=1 Tax=Meiothermus sp. TaxID=1955249 RepID=UPI00307E8225
MSVPPYNRIPEVPQIVIRGEAWRFNGRLTDRQGAILTWAGYSMGLEIWPAFSGPGADNPFYTAESSEVTLEPNGTFEINIAGTKTAASASNRAVHYTQCKISVSSTTLTHLWLRNDRSVPGAANTGLTGAQASRYARQTSTANLTGTQTVTLGVRSSTTTATQTATLESWRITVHPSNP